VRKKHFVSQWDGRKRSKMDDFDRTKTEIAMETASKDEERAHAKK
jgi:hypothetical protein